MDLFLRYIDDIFMTWNGSEKDLIACLTEANTWNPHIQLDYKIGKSLPFLDVVLTNAKGRLETCVYHKPAAQPYVIPFVSDHPRHVFRNIIQSTLRRAVRYSSTLEIFHAEQRYIKLMLLYNGYAFAFAGFPWDPTLIEPLSDLQVSIVFHRHSIPPILR